MTATPVARSTTRWIRHRTFGEQCRSQGVVPPNGPSLSGERDPSVHVAGMSLRGRCGPATGVKRLRWKPDPFLGARISRLTSQPVYNQEPAARSRRVMFCIECRLRRPRFRCEALSSPGPVASQIPEPLGTTDGISHATTVSAAQAASSAIPADIYCGLPLTSSEVCPGQATEVFVRPLISQVE